MQTCTKCYSTQPHPFSLLPTGRTAMLEMPISIRSSLQLTCEKDVGMGLCMLCLCYPLHFVCLLFGTSIPTSPYIFKKKSLTCFTNFLFVIV